MFKNLTNVIYDKTFKITVLKDKINITNYQEILVFEDETILVKTTEKLIRIKGENLIWQI